MTLVKTSNDEFAFSVEPEPHRARTKQLLNQHPEIRNLIGSNPATFWWTVGGEGFESLAMSARRMPGPSRFAEMLTGRYAFGFD